MRSCPSSGLRRAKQLSCLASKRRGCGAGQGPKIKRPGSGGGAAIRVSGECGWGDPHFSHFTGSTHHSSAGTVSNRTSCHQGVRRGRATRYLMHAVRRSGLAGPLAAGLGEPDDDGERGCRKSDVAGGQGGHFCRSSAGPRPHVALIEAPRFWMMSSNVSGLFRWGTPSASWLIGEDSLKQCFRACSGIGACVAVCCYLLSARIVKAVAGAGIKLERDVAAKRTAALDKPLAELVRGLLIGCAVEGATSERPRK